MTVFHRIVKKKEFEGAEVSPILTLQKLSQLWLLSETSIGSSLNTTHGG